MSCNRESLKQSFEPSAPLVRRPSATAPLRRPTPTLSRPLQTPTRLAPIRTRAPLAASTSSPLSPIPEHSPLSFSTRSPTTLLAPRSPIVPIDPEPFIGMAEVEARRRRETLEAAVWGGKVFRPAGVAGKGTHRRAEAPARRQPPAPKFQEFHLRTEVRGIMPQAEVARQRAVKELGSLWDANLFHARPAPRSLRHGPPVELTRMSPSRRAALQGKATGAVDRSSRH
ncbi:hypothetical protein KFL_008560020 [Klebsormidium nitens]|uniref:Uncharacterized protein n=1 Tax=Klebsormidium nitens TaxID=105231 RepID=A0A1Y1INX5_KLENI|nr:hypothetical protein KFL_008560020 [Klebsormidium nitens]|eukprot:GAQ91792.1 hypothetical protein KFL_008560020 [Klebsormidium nitens]